MFLVWLLAAQLAAAAGLDQVEVGGLWGHPLSTDATSVHWNPAGMAAESGTSFVLEGAPIFAAVEFDREHPHFGGNNSYRTTAVAPFAAFKTKIKQFAFGLAVAVPYGKSSRSLEGDFGTGSYTLIRGGSFTTALEAAVAWDFGQRVQIGGAFSAQMTQMGSHVNKSLVPEIVGFLGPLDYTEASLEDPDYATTTHADGLKGIGFTGSIGLRVQLSPKWVYGISYLHGAPVSVNGEGRQKFACGAPDDEIAQAALGAMGLCNADLQTQMNMRYTLPWRIQMALQWNPNENLEITWMGTYVHWKTFSDYEITISEVDILNDVSERAAETLHSTRLMARDNQPTFWSAADVKYRFSRRVLLGGRLTYDHPAVPEYALSANNFDSPTVHVGALGAFEVVRNLQLGLGLTHQFIVPRRVTHGGFSMSLQPPEASQERWFWASNKGTYKGRITRMSLSIRGSFGGK